MKTFSVTWVKETAGPLSAGTDLYAGKKSPYVNTTSVTITEGSILTKVQFELTWKDDHTIGLLIKRGLDKLTAEITHGDELQSYSEKGGGNYTFPFSVGDQPQDEYLDAENISEVEQAVKDKYLDKNKASFDVTVKVKIGEKPRRLLKFLMDKGNPFELTITYEYYTPQITEESGDGGDNYPPEQPSTPHTSLMITNLNYRQ
jgi:hypothetical protein